MCKCGCNTCGDKAPILKEGVDPRINISKELQYHINKKIPLYENVFRIGSDKYFDLIKEARLLYRLGQLQVNEGDQRILETDLGEFGVYEGQVVPLDMPMVSEEISKTSLIPLIKQYAPGAKLRFKGNFAYINIPYDAGSGFLGAMGSQTMAGQQREQGAEDAMAKSQKIIDSIKNQVEDYEISDLENGFVQVFLVSDGFLKESTNEAKYQGKEVSLNKPKRGGSKKFYVYVRDPKSKNIRKVSFGAAGGGQKLSVKFKDSKARKAFADRHNCSSKKDRTKAGYWSCNLPRYAKSLGLGSNMNTYW